MRRLTFLRGLCLVCGITLFTPTHAAAVPPADSAKARLFDFSQPLFPSGSSNTKMQWEKEFIEAGTNYEKDQSSFITRVIGWAGFSAAGGFDLSYYRSNYMWSSGNYYYYFFKNPADHDLFYTKEVMQDAYLLNHVDRSSENLLLLWSNFGDFVKPMVAPYIGVGKPERRYIVNLLEAWKCIRSVENYEDKLNDIYDKIADDAVGSWDHETHIAPVRCTDFDERLNGPSSYYLTWYYTFWVRRHHEGSSVAVQKILSDLLREHYKD